MKSKRFLFVSFLLACVVLLQAQVNPFKETANSVAGVYNDVFLYGSNMSYKNSSWTDGDVADLLIGNPAKGRIGVGANSLHLPLYHDFLEKWGYNIRIDYFKHYQKIGAKTNVIFMGGRPTPECQENAFYCKDDKGVVIKKDNWGNSLQSKLYRNMYEPIWKNGANGQKTINENNYYALYVYKLVEMYKDHCLFYEITNEPDYTYSGLGYRSKGDAGNWWDNDPNPRDLSNLLAPVEGYVRLLRISYEVIKTLQPEALVCLGGIGYESFLDALLRNTDNPDGGKVTVDYPHQGGAWFDCLSYHSYPMYYLREWVGNNVLGNIEGYRHFRHSDAAVEATINHKKSLEAVLTSYGYDNRTYPRKATILTETNVPNKQVKTFIGGEVQQRNFLMKLAIMGQKNGIRAIYPFAPWDDKEQNQDGGDFDYNGFYYPIPDKPTVGTLRMHQSGIGWRTTSNLLGGKGYNEAETQKLQLPSNVDGAAFGTGNNLIYALWARTSKDLDETAGAQFTLPQAGASGYKKTTWEGKESVVASLHVALTGDVTFFKPELANSTTRVEAAGIAVYTNPADTKIHITATQPIKQIQIYTLLGQWVCQLTTNTHTAHSNPMLPGLYVVRVTAGSETVTQKVWVQ